MRFACSIVTLLLCAISLAAQTAPQKPPKKGDMIIIRGCLRGSSVEQADLMVEKTPKATSHVTNKFPT